MLSAGRRTTEKLSQRAFMTDAQSAAVRSWPSLSANRVCMSQSNSVDALGRGTWQMNPVQSGACTCERQIDLQSARLGFEPCAAYNGKA